jgi:hypothetical protein
MEVCHTDGILYSPAAQRLAEYVQKRGEKPAAGVRPRFWDRQPMACVARVRGSWVMRPGPDQCDARPQAMLLA